jgi:hypothetical protein
MSRMIQVTEVARLSWRESMSKTRHSRRSSGRKIWTRRWPSMPYCISRRDETLSAPTIIPG